MGPIRTPQADSDLDEIWYYVATKKGSLDIAERFLDSIVDRFLILGRIATVKLERLLRFLNIH